MLEILHGVIIGTPIGITVGIILVSIFEGKPNIFYLYISLYFVHTPINSIRVRRKIKLLFYRLRTFNFSGEIMNSIITNNKNFKWYLDLIKKANKKLI